MTTKILIILAIFIGVNSAFAQTTEFTYQGRLVENSIPADASYDFEFRLYDVDTGGAALGTVQRLGVSVSRGIFTVKLDFGANFNGQPRWLEIAVKPAGSPNPLTVLAPRQAMSSAPYSIRSLNSTTADISTNSQQLGGVVANQFVQTTDTRLSDARNPLPNSANYIQNATTPQTASNFNITGDGTANIFNAATQYNIGGSRVLFTSSFSGNIFAGNGAGAANGFLGGNNSFFGLGAGQSNVSGGNNSFFGKNAGNSNTAGNNSFFGEQSGFGTSSGGNNSFFGQFSGRNNLTGGDNAFFGYRAGANNTASGNSFFGSGAGDSVTSGASNAFFGRNAGTAVITASGNSFFGYQAGLVNTVADNSFFGAFAGDSNTTGTKNSFFGGSTGSANVTGNNNSFFGYHAGRVSTASDNSFFGSDTGSQNTTGTNNSFFGARSGVSNTSGISNSFFGSFAGYFTTTGIYNAFFGTGAGYNNTSSRNSFFGSNAGEFNTSGDGNSFFGFQAGNSNSTGRNNVFIGRVAGLENTVGISNVFIGDNAGSSNISGRSNTFVGGSAGYDNTTGSNNTVLGSGADVGSGSLVFATAIGASARVSTSNTVVIGRGLDEVVIPGKLNVDNFGTGGSTDVCRNSSSQLALCSSSLRYKDNVQTFFGGLDIVKRLRPITFNWKDGGKSDVGFAAEEVNQIEPILTTRNANGEIEGVKYAQITTVLVNAVNEQQAQIEAQAKQIEEQQRQIDALKKIVCLQNANAEICKEQ